MSTRGGPEESEYRILPTPPPEGAEGPRLEDLSEDEVEYLIQDLDTAESPTGGAAVRCARCGCYCIAAS